jgi:hypothetical protein
MAKNWGLLQGLGQGLNQVGGMLMQNKFDEMKEQRLRAYQQGLVDQANKRDDAIRAEDREIRAGENAAAEERWNATHALAMSADARASADQTSELDRLETDAAYTDTSIRDGKEFKLFFNKRGEKIGEVEMGEPLLRSTSGSSREYLDPMTERQIDAVTDDMAEMRRMPEYDRPDNWQQEYDGLRTRRDRLMGVGQDDSPSEVDIQRAMDANPGKSREETIRYLRSIGR